MKDELDGNLKEMNTLPTTCNAVKLDRKWQPFQPIEPTSISSRNMMKGAGLRHTLNKHQII